MKKKLTFAIPRKNMGWRYLPCAAFASLAGVAWGTAYGDKGWWIAGLYFSPSILFWGGIGLVIIALLFFRRAWRYERSRIAS